MRVLMLTAGLLLVTGCAGLPAQDPAQAWIDLKHHSDTTLQALEVDDRIVTDERYFEVPPGRHALKVRYQFAVEPTNIGPDAEPLWRDCQLKVTFATFNAGQRYQLHAANIGWRPSVRLYDQQHNVVGQGQPAGCQRS